MTTVRTRRTGTGYEAAAMWVIQQWLETPHNHLDVAEVDPAGPVRRTRDLPWEICLLAEAEGQALRQGYRVGNGAGEADRSQQRP